MQLRMFCSPIVIKLTLVGFLFSLAPFPLAGQQTKLPQKAKKFNVAVLDFDARAGISKDEAASLSDAFSSEIIRIGEFVVVDRNRLRSILQEQGFQQSEACSQVECVVEVGRILKVEKMFVGTVGKVGNTFTVTIQVVDVQSSHIEATVNKPYRGEIDGLLTEVIPSIAVELSGKLTGKDIASSSSGGASWLWYVGGVALLGGGAAAFLMKPKSNNETTPISSDLPRPPALP
jgi:TolB-like protein